MTITGLPENLFWALLGGSGAAVTLLYLLKLRRRRVIVPFSPLWVRVIEQREATSLFKALRRIFSWLVQMIFATLVVLALGDLRSGNGANDVGYTVVLLDASASMTAEDDSPSRLERAKAETRSVIRDLGSEEQAMIVEVGAQAMPLGTFTKDKDALLGSIERVRSSDTPADLARALSTAVSSLRGRPKPRIVILSDGRLPQISGVDLQGIEVQGKLVGKSGDNVGITSFNVRRYLASPGEYEAYLEIRNYADRPATCDVTLSVVLPGTCRAPEDCPQGFECDKLLSSCANPQAVIPPVSLAARGTWKRVLSSLSSDGGRLVATVEPREFRDPFPKDNRAYAYLPPRRPARILFVTEQNLFLEALLLLDPQNVVSKIRPADYRPGGKYDVTIFDGVAPETGGQTGNFVYINPEGPHSPILASGTPVKAPVVASLKSTHPVLRWVALKDLNISEARPLKTGAGDVTLVSGVGQGGRDAPLLVARETSKGKTLVFAFDFKRSDLPLRWSFPILVPNIVSWMKGESREENSSFLTGQRWNIPVSRALREVIAVGPDGARVSVPVRDGHAQLFGTQAGFYELFASGEARPSVTVAANLQDPEESDIRPPVKLMIAGIAAGEITRAGVVDRDLWVYLLLVALALSALEWVSYHRRVTV
jgi:hypothetical protein